MKKTLNYLLVLIMSIWDLILLIGNITNGTMARVPTELSLFLVLLIPLILEKILKKKLSTDVKFIYNIFIFLALFLGSVINLYKSVYWFDDFTHYMSGVLSACLANLIYNYSTKNKHNTFIKVTYILGFSFMTAGLWEIFEFLMDTFTSSDLQHAISSGVKDTMYDIIAAFLGCIFYQLLRFKILKHDEKIKLFQ